VFNVQHAIIIAGIALAAVLLGIALRQRPVAIVAAGLLSFVAVLPLVSKMSKVEMSEVARANLHMSNREYHEALRIFKANNLDLDSAECCMYLGDDDGAFYYTQKSLNGSREARNRAHLIRGLILKKRGDIDGAMGEFVSGHRGGDVACTVHVKRLKEKK
jgi:hypothetical protein